MTKKERQNEGSKKHQASEEGRKEDEAVAKDNEASLL